LTDDEGNSHEPVHDKDDNQFAWGRGAPVKYSSEHNTCLEQEDSNRRHIGRWNEEAQQECYDKLSESQSKRRSGLGFGQRYFHDERKKKHKQSSVESVMKRNDNPLMETISSNRKPFSQTDVKRPKPFKVRKDGVRTNAADQTEKITSLSSLKDRIKKNFRRSKKFRRMER